MCDTKYLLEHSCRRHLPELSAVWNSVFGERCRCVGLDISLAATFAHHLDVSTDNVRQVAYSPDGVAADDDKRRRRLTLGRYLARQHKIEITPQIERGVNLVVADMLAACGPVTDDEFTILRGDDVTAAYVNAVGARSCMVGRDNESITEWFSLFPDKIGLLVWAGTEGRALLWTTDDGSMRLDRIYAGNQGLARERYSAWCEANGVKQCYRNFTGDIDTSGCVTLGRKAVDGRLVPYLDTWHRATHDGRLYADYTSGCSYDLQSTDGTAVCGGTICESCGERVDDDDCYGTEDGSMCSACYHENYFCCERCDECCHNDDARTVDDQTWCESCRDRHATECQRCEEYTIGETREVSGETWCDTCADDHATECQRCECCIATDDTCEISGETWCDSCAENHSQTCHDCRSYFPLDDLATVGGNCYCEHCAPETESIATLA